MDKIDKFIVNNVSPPNEYLSYEDTNNKESNQKVILIYGDNELTKLIKAYLNSEIYIYEAITEFNNISSDNKYSCILALSYNDVDNMMIGSVGLKVYGISHIIALCNSQNNLKLYNEFNFDKVLLYDAEMDKLFNIVKGFVKNAIENEV
jgi:Trk K+ transport system NAD-binding subunit